MRLLTVLATALALLLLSAVAGVIGGASELEVGDAEAGAASPGSAPSP